MKSKNKRARTDAESRHVDAIKKMPCAVCDSLGPSEAHEPEQSLWFISIPLCPECHRGSHGWHGDRQRWKLRKVTELAAINKTLEAILS